MDKVHSKNTPNIKIIKNKKTQKILYMNFEVIINVK